MNIERNVSVERKLRLQGISYDLEGRGEITLRIAIVTTANDAIHSSSTLTVVLYPGDEIFVNLAGAYEAAGAGLALSEEDLAEVLAAAQRRWTPAVLTAHAARLRAQQEAAEREQAARDEAAAEALRVEGEIAAAKEAEFDAAVARAVARKEQEAVDRMIRSQKLPPAEGDA